MRRFIATFSAMFLFTVGIAQAAADTMGEQWMIEEASGTVTIKSFSGEMLGTQAGTQLVAPFTITTGADGRVVVSHRLDKLTVGANSQSTVAVPKHAKEGIFTLIKQKLGSVLYEVQHRVKDSFEVDTPYLVSVVKGTTFNIHVTQSASSVSLVEGRLQVYTPDGKSELMLSPGQAAIKSIHNKGIILKDQQSLSKPVQGRITVVKDGQEAAYVVPAVASLSNASAARNKALERAPLTDIGSPIDRDRGESAERKAAVLDDSMIDIGAAATRVPTGVSIGSGAVAGIDASVSGAGGGLNAAGAVNLDSSTPGLTSSVNGSAGTLDLGASVPVVSTNANIGGGSVSNIDSSVPGVSAGASIGGTSAVDVSASVPGVSTSANISNSGTVNLTTSVPGVSTGVNSGGGTANIETGAGSTTSTDIGGAVSNVTTTLSSPTNLLGQ